ncbi:restriction endonuclease subunit S [Pseudosulfitobacter pseudonitzschiae]|uniref:restriction endonuclease subunit S n=1 Tax=Pseudosulfitobacter pseudonitzschiae TaxID=1402135 RepID=UPI001583DD02|nr:restriction endonuclease subunit S [Pseudosulfitobacter pseudonitzschiae]QKS07453.1 restriction endonuclease subunit S [Pseudosulfitobacter pseudonitzschiae]
MREGWELKKLGDVGECRIGLTYSPDDVCAEGGTLVLRSSNVQNGRITYEDNVLVQSDVPQNVIVREGDILICVRNGSRSLIGKSAMISSADEGHAFGAFMATFRSHYGEYVFQLLQTNEFKRQVHRTLGATINQITNADLKSFKFLFPSLPEQRKIAAILETWDEALEKLNALRAVKARWLEGLTQTTIGRGGVFPEHWQQKPLSEACTPVKRKSSGGNHPVMTISAKSGFLMQADKFARDMAGRSVERYTLLHEGEFAYNKGNSKTAPYGCVFRLDRDTALVPFVYYCFALKPGLDPEFYDHLFAAGALNHQLSRLINSGVRNDGLLNLYSDDFFSCRVPVPPIEEQKRIAQALTTAKRELALLDEEIAALTDQKRGLMQKLLTGEWRVEVSDDEEAAA